MSSRASDPTKDAQPQPLRTELVIPSSPEYLSLLRCHVRWFCERCECPQKDASRIVLAVVEAVTNIIRHAYQGDTGRTITLRFTELPAALEIEFLDRGRHVSPSEHKGRDLEEVEPGGLGLHMIERCMDDIRYERRPGGGTRLVLKKLLGDGEATAEAPEKGQGD